VGAKLGVKISIHAPTRGATARVPSGSAPRHNFNPRAHAGRDLRSPSIRSRRFYFNPRAHAGRDPVQGAVGQAPGYFNPRAHAGRDIGGFNLYAHVSISIHAPTRGATCKFYFPCGLVAISIHAPTRGATYRFGRCPFWWQYFNPRAHAGRDRALKSCMVGASLFQSTRPRGARPVVLVAQPGVDLFQSTRPRGARPPTTGGGCPGQIISIHAPTRGATRRRPG